MQIEMNDRDFQELVADACEWNSLREYAGVFEGEDPSQPPAPHWKMVYWLGQDYAAAILAKAFLSHLGYKFETGWDTSDERGGRYIICTDYDGTEGRQATGAADGDQADEPDERRRRLRRPKRKAHHGRHAATNGSEES